MAKNLAIGILAHVDAGKTTLSEAMLYLTGAIRKAGRVDHRDAFLDTDSVEKERGITIYSKEARFTLGDRDFTLVDTPGHADFSTEMERTLGILDYAVLVISGSDGVQSHTMTLWKLFKAYKVPVFIFVNKMDQPEADRLRIMNQLKVSFGEGMIEMIGSSPKNPEDMAMYSEEMMNEYLDSGRIPDEMVQQAILERKIFPVCFGSALKMEGVDFLLKVLEKYTCGKNYGNEFGAKVYKIIRDGKGNRLTCLKVTGGILKNKMLLNHENLAGEGWEEKVEQIRVYSGTGFQAVNEAESGMVVSVTGLTQTYAGEGLGSESENEDRSAARLLQPAMTYRMTLPKGVDPAQAMGLLSQLDEENPALNIVWNEETHEINVQIMGDLEIEILKHQIKERFDLDVDFDRGSIIYRETINKAVIGVGHFEPLRHYAEVQLLLEPQPLGTGLVFDSLVSEDVLAKNWQRLITTHLMERRHRGTLTRSEITDMKISIVAGRAHNKHTEGGDFRQATYRAIRQALMKALEGGNMVLLEPVYSFSIEVPSQNVGRTMTDMEKMGAKCSLPEMSEDGSITIISGTGPVATLQNYQREINAYTAGKGRMIMVPDGFAPCHNQEEVVEARAYNAEQDHWNPAGSVFCQHGSGTYVDWRDVDDMAHTQCTVVLSEDGSVEKAEEKPVYVRTQGSISAGEKELEEIFLRTYGKSKRDEQIRRENQSKSTRRGKSDEVRDFPQPKWTTHPGAKKLGPYYIVDGYNVIFAWDELKTLAERNIDAARDALIDILLNYQGYKKADIVVVFDGYKVAGNPGTRFNFDRMKVVYTKEAETADRFIENTIYEMGKKYDVTVITSDRPVQMAAMGDGAARYSAREFHDEVMNISEEIRNKLGGYRKSVNKPFEKAFSNMKEGDR